MLVLFLSSAEVVRIPSQAFDPTPPATLLLVMAHARPEYLRRCLSSVVSYKTTWPMVVSIDCQDGDMHADVRKVVSDVQSTTGGGAPLDVWHHDVSYAGDRNDDGQETLLDVRSYKRIARHYRWAIRRAFKTQHIDRIVVLEDDMEVAPDFFSYFDHLAPLLHSDPTLFCISAWNDNGKGDIVSDAEQLHRTDFFPGLGWMLTRSLWEELEPGWPEVYWDDWLRSHKRTRGRQCIRPEISRTANFGAKGVSQSFNHDKHVSKVVLNKHPINFSALDLSYLQPKAYESLIFGRISRAVLLKYSNYLTSKPQDADVIARYPPGNLKAIGKRTGIMTDHREGMFRTSYQGVVIVPWNGHWAFMVPRGWEPPSHSNYSLGALECCGR